MATAPDALHLLSIDLASAPSSLRAALQLNGDDVEHWLGRAVAAGVTLAIVCGPESVDLYSTEAGRHDAFKPLLQSLWSLGRNLEGFERVRTTEASGHAVVTHLMGQAASGKSAAHGFSYADAIDQGYSLAALNGTLCPELQELFELASITAHRGQVEIESAPHSEPLAPLTSVPPLRSSMAPAYGPREPGSMLRLRMGANPPAAVGAGAPTTTRPGVCVASVDRSKRQLNR